MNENNQRSRGRTGRRVTTAAAAAALLLLAGRGLGSGGWGLLPGDGTSLLPNAEEREVVEAKTETVEEPAAAEDGVLTVRVQEHTIYLEDEALSPEALEERLLSLWHEGDAVELIDDGAIKADYDAAAAVLDRLQIPYERAG